MNKLPRTILTLKKRTATLRTVLARGGSEYLLFKAALRVRDARIAVLRATIGQIPSPLRTPQPSKRIAKLSGQIASLRAATPMAILAEFRQARPATLTPDKWQSNSGKL